ncbi:MAG: FAD-binding oxidoreductase [Pigmentiphaga sp.]
MTDRLLEECTALLGPQGILAPDVLAARTTHGLGAEGFKARFGVRPASTGEVSRVLALCNQHGVPVVTHGGLTGLTRGTFADPACIVLSTERMNSVLEVSASQRVAVVQAGVILATLQEAAEAEGLFFPLDLGSRGSATVGGCLATNAGGNRVFRYGMMRDSVLGLEAVLAHGTVVSSMNRLIKNNAGYDLKPLFIGSEGTLGIVTQAVVRLRERPVSRCMALVALADFEQAGGLFKHMDGALAGKLAAFEMMWSSFYKLVTTPPATSRPPLPQDHSFYVLIESLGADQERDQAQFEDVLAAAWDAGLIVDAAIAASQAQCQEFWHMRDDVQQFSRLGEVHAYDVSLPLDDMPAYVERVRVAAARDLPEAQVWTYGHLGDNNLHVVITHEKPVDHAVYDAVVYTRLADYGGSISGEHGIGIDKKAWLPLCRNPAEIALMRTLKQTLDPRGTLNPNVLGLV